MLGLLQRLHKLDILEELRSTKEKETHKIVYPRQEKYGRNKHGTRSAMKKDPRTRRNEAMQKRRGQGGKKTQRTEKEMTGKKKTQERGNEMTQTGNYVTLREITNEKILETLKKSVQRAQTSMIELEMAEDLKELKKWEYMNYDESLDYNEKESDEDSEDEDDEDYNDKNDKKITSKKVIEDKADEDLDSLGDELTQDLQELEETQVLEKSVVKKVKETLKRKEPTSLSGPGSHVKPTSLPEYEKLSHQELDSNSAFVKLQTMGKNQRNVY